MMGLMLLGLALALGAQELDKDDEGWLEREVAAIITQEETELFRSLSRDEDRDLFRDIFWSRRDPTPGTSENEFQRDYEERVAIADVTLLA